MTMIPFANTNPILVADRFGIFVGCIRAGHTSVGTTHYDTSHTVLFRTFRHLSITNPNVAKKIHVIIIDYNQIDLWSCGGVPPGSLIIINYNLRFFVTLTSDWNPLWILKLF